ncbi:MAG: hypothetical protein ACFFGP_08740 [Promethearchaeota archaeon]
MPRSRDDCHEICAIATLGPTFIIPQMGGELKTVGVAARDPTGGIGVLESAPIR